MDFRHASAPHSPSARSPSPPYTARRIPDLPVKHQLFPFSPPIKAVRPEGDADYPPSELDPETSFAVVQKLPAQRNTPATHIPSEYDEPQPSRRLSSPLFRHRGISCSSNEQTLLRAAEQNDVMLCRSLLDEDDALDANCTASESGWTPLHFAASRGYVRVCEVLLDYGSRVDIDSKTQCNQTPLHLAAMGGHKTVVQLLVRSGADINAQDSEGNSALHLSSSRGFTEIVQWLMLRNPDVTLRNSSGFRAEEQATEFVKTVFQCSIRTKSTEVAEHSTLSQVPIVSSCKEDVTHMLTKVRKSLSRSFSNPSFAEERKPSTLDFEAIQELGRGSFGEVFLVRHITSTRLYAMKVLRKDKILGQNLLKYALTERNVLSYIEHPFIVKLNYAFQTTEKLFLILDYCPGGDLGYHLQREKRFSEYRARLYMCEIILALEELHRRKILFRDLKPDNVLLDAEGHVRLTDFGLSKENIRSDETTKSFCGSLAYLAPEMLQRVGHGKAVDWYLLGVLMYNMLVGEPPYFSLNKEQLFHNIQRGKLKLPAYVSQEARALLIELLQRDPAKRLGSGARDAEEIKEHRFFYGVNWTAVANRELRPPIPLRPTAPSGVVRSESVLGSNGGDFQQVDGWSFVSGNVE